MHNTHPNWSMRTRLKTRQLLLLIALDQQRNIHRAAESLSMTQPAASKQLRDLEDMLDVRLFERLPRGMLPTIFGEAMIRHARMALTSRRWPMKAWRDSKSGYRARLRLAPSCRPAWRCCRVRSCTSSRPRR